jgi:short subunit dehydrogenase-like uncharacterized protein
MPNRSQTSIHLLGIGGFTGNLIHKTIAQSLALRMSTSHISRALPLDAQLDGLRRSIEPGDVVLNCLGPFRQTYSDVLALCMDSHAHYLDICAEWRVLEALHTADRSAREAEIMMLPAIGFDVLASDCLAAHVAKRLPNANRLQIGISGLELVSRGSARTIADLIGEPVRSRRDGVIVAGSRLREASFDFGNGPTKALGVSWGDISTAYYTTGIRNIEVYFEATPASTYLAFANRTFGWLMGNPAIERTARQLSSGLRPGPTAAERAARRVTTVARASDARGRTAESRLITNEAYTFTAQAACAVMQRIAGGCFEPGFQTPGKLLGPDFVLQIEGSERHDV